MVTRWKNTIKNLWKFFEEGFSQREKVMLGTISMTGGIFFILAYILGLADYGGLGRACWLGMGTVLIMLGLNTYIMSSWEKNVKMWKPIEENFYDEWKKKVLKVEAVFLGTSMAIFIILYLWIIEVMSRWWIFQNIKYVWLALVVLSQLLLICLFDVKTKELVADMTEVTKEKIALALEIERASLEKVSRSDKLRVDLITNVSHDLKTPLTSIIGYLELMKKEELSDVMKDYVEVVSERADKLKEMIGSLFSLAKASSGNVELHKEKFEVNRLLEQLLADMKDKVDESRLHFVTLLTNESTELYTDNIYFYRICQNLVENALKYALKGTRVFVRTYTKEENLFVEIVNTSGYFMNFEKEEILEKFARGDKERSTEGNGLGLAIVSTYASALGGEFDIQIECDQFKACLKFPRC